MSNRSLMEFNHDLWFRIDNDPNGFVLALQAFLASASDRNAKALIDYGVRVFGTRHHSDEFNIKWGAHKATYPTPTHPHRES